MRETPSRPEPPQPRPGRAFAHTPGAVGSGTPHRSDSCPPHTPRGVRRTGHGGRPGTTPPVPDGKGKIFDKAAQTAIAYSRAV
ncbi:hypothetical protein ABZ129_33525, partial [Streptomyces sp. NPDC006307]